MTMPLINQITSSSSHLKNCMHYILDLLKDNFEVLHCETTHKYNRDPTSHACLINKVPFYPKDIWFRDSPFAALVSSLVNQSASKSQF